MGSCIRQSKKYLPYGGFLTKLFQHFEISLDTEASVSLTESIDSANLKSSHLSLVDGDFMRLDHDIASVNPQPTPIPHDPLLSPHSLKIMTILNQILANQVSMKEDITDIKRRLTTLEKGKLSMDVHKANLLFRWAKDEFIDLQAGFELHTIAMVEALQRKMNRNACQLSQELKFVCNQVGILSRFVARCTNEIGEAF